MCLWKVGLPLQSKTGNHSHPEMTWGARNIAQPALLKLMILYTWDVCLSESLEVPKGSQATCSVWCGSRGGYGANAREIDLISIWFWVHQAILHSWGEVFPNWPIIWLTWKVLFALSLQRLWFGKLTSKPRHLGFSNTSQVMLIIKIGLRINMEKKKNQHGKSLAWSNNHRFNITDF